MKYYLRTDEQETTITITRGVDDALIYTSDRLMMTKLDRRCKELPDVYKCIWDDTQIMGDKKPMGKRYSCPAKLIRFGKLVFISEERKAAARERGKQNAERLRLYRTGGITEQT